MNKIRVNFVDFWPHFNKKDNYFYHLLSLNYEVEIDERNPDLLFFSVDYARNRERDRYLGHPCKKIFYSGENVRPNFDFPGSIEYPSYSIGKCDYAFTFDYSEDPRHYRLPLWVLFVNWFDLPDNPNRDPSYLIPLHHLTERATLPLKTKFCNFVFSNTSGMRLEILDAIHTYRRVDCAGSLRNNMGYQVEGRGDQRSKIDFLQHYKFTVATENSSHAGYTTEKLIHPLSVGSIPIYWGSEKVEDDFNAAAIIDVKKYDSLDEVVDIIHRIDENDELYQMYLDEPIFKNNEVPACFLPQSVLHYVEERILC